jgi:succinate dehydrogenase / fumarate reductase, cytochrome b subunit
MAVSARISTESWKHRISYRSPSRIEILMLCFLRPQGTDMAKTVFFYGSSIGQKIVSALTGFFLCAFLVVHLAGNLLLFKNDGGQSFNEYAAGNASNLLMRSLEIFLFAGFAIHIFWGVRIWIMNRRARPKNYVEYHPSVNSSLFSRVMLISGSLVLLFLVVHLKGFWVPMRFGAHELSEYDIVSRAFQNPLYDFFYIFCLVLLSFHLRQGFQSAFQTLGLRPLWLKAIDWAAAIFWLLMPAAFAAMPLYFLFRKGG